MKQVVQSYKTGDVTLEEVPVPHCSSKNILVKNHYSLVSIGTERSTIELGKKSLVGKAKARPDLLKQAIEKAKKEGFIKTFQEAMGRLDVPTPLGYSCAGEIIECGHAAHEFSPGDRVACVGQGFASHAEYVSIPVNLACKLPENVSDEAAAFGMLGIIAMHGIRKANLTLGSVVVVSGLGLLGLLSVQMLKAYGCYVIAMDLVKEKVDLAKQLGADFATTNPDDLLNHALSVTNGNGADATVLTLATKSQEPIDLSINLTRSCGKIVVVGTADIHPDRNELWQKEIEIVVSKAAGPGSLDPLYEKEGIDIPIDCARWTQKRNLEEFIRLISQNLIDIQPLITHRFKIEQAEATYQDILSGKIPSVIGVLFEYDKQHKSQASILPVVSKKALKKGKNLHVNVIGAGLFGKALLIPALTKTKGIQLNTLVTSTGVNAAHSAKKFGFKACSTDLNAAFEDEKADAIMGLAPHSMHAELVKSAIIHQKPLFLEKPLCINEEELAELIEVAQKAPTLPLIMIGHNRRFSPHAIQMKKWLANHSNPLVLLMRLNTGFVPPDHWVHSDAQGRSRIVGEMSHFIDLIQYLVDAKPETVYAQRISGNDTTAINNDNVSVSLKFQDGSIATLIYTALGYKGYSRERTEIFFDGKTICSTDFKKTELHAQKNKVFKTSGQEMGYKEELHDFFHCLRNETLTAVSFEDMVLTIRIIFAIEKSLAEGQPIAL